MPAPEDPQRSALRAAVSAEAWEEMQASEDLLAALRPALTSLGRAVENLRLPDPTTRELFAVAVEATDLADGALDAPGRPLGGLAVTVRDLPLAAPAAPVATPELDLWRPLLAAVERFDHAGFGVVSGRFASPERRVFETELAFGGNARLQDGARASAHGAVRLRWERRPDADSAEASSWRIAAWRTLSLDVRTAPRPLFREVLDEALPDPDALRRARRSRHEERVVEKLLHPERFEPPHPHFFQGSQDRHPGIAVADVNGDGFDDVYVMARWGANQLFLNRGNGRFEERARELGLDVRDHSASAVFADFDNDGDPDVFIGRTLAPSVYLENRDGRFVDRSPHALPEDAPPKLVASVSSADVDGDGLLDVYVSTYAAQMLVSEMLEKNHAAREFGIVPQPSVLADFLPDADAKALFGLTRSQGAHQFLSLPGPPNVLLRNVGGGRFRAVPGDSSLHAFRNTYQATWSDYDDDGDPDLYLAHDFSPNQLLRNEDGERFTDVTTETGTADIGFGMGVGWGDYDRDGRVDLYVSNMFSKAGRRITGFFPDLDPRFRKMARGNTLFRQTDAGFEAVSGLGEGDVHVEKAGWSWGGQFGDFDNDAFLDLYVLSGYYTAPEEAHVDVDI